MILDIIDSVLEAENKADIMQQEAKLKADAIFNTAEKRLSEMNEEAELKAKKQRAEALKKAQLVAEERHQAILSQADLDAESFKKTKADKKVELATKLFGRILNDC